MRILSLDTSFSAINLTVLEEGKVVLHHCVDDRKKTLEHLPALLKRLDIYPEEMDAFAVSLGVGYLNSLRIGITFIKTLAYLSKKPVFGYENLHLMCLFVKCPQKKRVVLKVSNNLFCRVCDGEQVSDIEVLKDPSTSLPLVGLSSQGTGEFQIEYFPFSLYGALWAYRRLSEGYGGDDPMLLEPVYLRPPV